MATIEQIRAARALLGWSQGDLADQAGMSQTGVARIENGTNQPNSNTLNKIHEAFDKADIEFIEKSGVKKRTSEIRVLRGVSGLRQVVDDIYETTKARHNKGEDIQGSVYLHNARPLNWHKWLGKEWWDMHSARMAELHSKIQYLLVSAGDDYLISSAFSEHRCFPDKVFNDQSIYAYGNKLAFVTFGDDIVVNVLENQEFCEGFRVLFDIAWNNAAKSL